MAHPHSHPSRDYPACSPLLEEAVPASIHHTGATLAFAFSRLPRGDTRPVMLVAPRWWTLEHGRPCLRRIGGELLLVVPRNDKEGLWAMEQGLRSGALAGVFGAVGKADLTQTRRLDFAARSGGSVALLLPREGGGLSAARRRWRIAAEPSAIDPFDIQAPGPSRVRAELVRRRDGPPGVWILEHDDETNRLRLADGLADHGLVGAGRTVAAA